MSEKMAAADQAVKFSRKCSACGLRNFVDAKVCRRCESDISRSSAWTKKIHLAPDVISEKVRQSKTGRVLIFALALAILSVLLMSYVRQVPQGTEPLTGGADIAQSAKPSDQSVPDPAVTDIASEEPAKEVLAGLKHFQDTPKISMTYEEYDQMLTSLKADLNNTLPAFVRQYPSDDRFRKEVAAALRDYTAAGNWWKTTIRNNKVLNDADRTARLQVEWASAQTHLDSAEKQLTR
ncbi:MAG: zinc finger Ran-binding domain-containing protein [Acidobacteriota bacterium]|nr:zinc finger Ran-binding domain-containing protein [Acidobacteriota bacterium]